MSIPDRWTRRGLADGGDGIGCDGEPTHPIDALSVTHVERYLSMKAAEVTRQTLQHTVAHLRAFLRYGFERA